jgi:uncharacterized membrane protein YgaE (UPF0421/DUF939 family)
MTLGPRVLKTGIAVTLALYICSLLNIEAAVFAGVAAIFTIQPSIYRTWKQMLDQIITNTLGAAVALFAIYFLGEHPITVGLLIMIVISLSLKLNMAATIPLTLVTVLAIIGAPGNEDVLFALNRFYSILIGIASAMLVNLFILPPKYKKNYLERVRAVFQNMSLLLRTAVSNEMTEPASHELIKKLKIDLQKLEEQYKIFDEERGKMARLNPLDVREIVVFKQMLKTLQQGEEVLENIEEHYFPSKTSEEESRMFDYHLERLMKRHEYFLLKYEGKIKDSENDFGNEIMEESAVFFERTLQLYGENKDQKLRLMIVASSIIEYTFHLQRLNTLIEQYFKATDR